MLQGFHAAAAAVACSRVQRNSVPSTHMRCMITANRRARATIAFFIPRCLTGPGRTVYFAGQLGIDKSGKMGANAREQMEIAFENVKAALASVDASFENVVKLNNYIIDIGTNIAHYREVRDKYVNTAAPPASTTIGVPQLARPGALFEVEAIAVLPPK